MKNQLFLLIVMSVPYIMAQTQVKTPKFTPEQKAAMRERMIKNTGGFLQKQGSGNFAFVRCKTKLSSNLLEDRAKRLAKSLRIKVNVKDAEFSIQGARNTLLGLGVNAAVFIVEDKAFPMSLIAQEECWGMINIIALMKDNPSQKKLEHRIHIMLTRVTAQVLGCAVIPDVDNALAPIHSLKDIDTIISDSITSSTAMGILKNLQALDIVQTRTVTYRTACQEGWAPAPTNDIQKAIWDKVHSVPQKPMKIEFDPKKGR